MEREKTGRIKKKEKQVQKGKEENYITEMKDRNDEGCNSGFIDGGLELSREVPGHVCMGSENRQKRREICRKKSKKKRQKAPKCFRKKLRKKLKEETKNSG